MSTFSFDIPPTHPILSLIQSRLNAFLGDRFPELDRHALLLCLVEAVQNARMHGGRPQDVRVEFSMGIQEFIARVWDHNPPFSLEKKGALPEDPYAESGRGLAIIEQLADGVALERYEGGNCLTLSMFIKKRTPTEKRESETLDLLYEMSESIVQANEVNFDRIYQLILDKAIEVFGVDRASIMNFDPERGLLKIVASRGIPEMVVAATEVKPGEGVSGRVFKEAKPLMVDRRAPASSYKSDSFISAPMLCSPMRMGETCMGVINITERRDGMPFEEKDLKLLTTLANQAASYVRIGHLIEQVKESQKLEQELAWARKIQRSLIPQAPLSTEAFDVSGAFEMAREVGGDYFDTLSHGPLTYIVIADVSGHNLPAALTMVNFRALLRGQIAAGGGHPADILKTVNALIYEDLVSNEQQITAALLCLNPITREINYANAGHHPLFYMTGEGRELTEWKADGILLGAMKEACYEGVRRTWKPGDSILLYTDGLLDARTEEGVPFGSEALKLFFGRHRGLKPTLLVTLILKEIHRHIGSTRFAEDDLALLNIVLK